MVAFPYQSNIPGAYDAIMFAAQAAFAGSDPPVLVRDGPWTAGESGGPYAQDLAIGWYGFYPGYQYPTRALSEELGQAAVTSTIQESGLGPSLEETFTVDCASLVLTGEDPSPAEWSKLRHSAYGNIAAMAGYMATPEAGELYLDGSVEKLTFARTTSCHLVAQRRGVLCIVTFSIEAVATAQR